MRERTRAQLDPLGSGEARTLWVLLAASAGLYATFVTATSWTTLPHKGLAIVGAALAVAASALTIWWTTPGRAPFTGRHHVGIHIIALLAMAAILWAQQPSTFGIGDAYPTFAIAGLVVAMSPYRPPEELLVVGATTATIAGFLVLIRALASDATLPALVFVVTAVTPILAITAALATYTETVLRTIEIASSSRRGLAEAEAEARNETDAPYDRITVMTQDALPLLQRIIDTGTLTRADRAEATRVGDALRAMLVAEMNSTWLDASQHGREGPRFSIADPAGLAREMVPSRRTVLRALLHALANEPGFTGGTVTLGQHAHRHQLSIEATFNATEYTTPPGHPVVSALLSVMRSVFTELETTRTQSRVLVTFGYEQD